MIITRQQLRRIIKEACGLSPEVDMSGSVMDNFGGPAISNGEVPVPEDYDSVKAFLSQNREAVDMAIETVMHMAGASCPKSTLAALVDHLKESQGESPLVDPVISLEKEPEPFY